MPDGPHQRAKIERSLAALPHASRHAEEDKYLMAYVRYLPNSLAGDAGFGAAEGRYARR